MTLRTVLSLALIFLLLTPLAAAQISPNARLLQRPEWDGAIGVGFHPDLWPVSFRNELRFQEWKNATAIMYGPEFAATFMEKIAAGGRFWCISYDPQPGDRETAFSDIDIWGKYQLLDDPISVSGGLLLTVPSGDYDIPHPLATGKCNPELFSAVRYYITDSFVLIAHLGVRFNIDRKTTSAQSETEEEIKGETSYQAGGGFILQILPELNLLGEINFETKRYSGRESEGETLVGAEYSLTDTCNLSGGVGFGFGDAAPEWESILAFELLL